MWLGWKKQLPALRSFVGTVRTGRRGKAGLTPFTLTDGHMGIIQLMGAGFLDQLATQLRINKTAACRRAIQRILDVVKKEYERGKYGSHTEAENEFRRLVDREEACK